MDLISVVSLISATVQIVFYDLILGVDNAMLIALMSVALPAHQRGRAILIGTGGAIGLRLLLILVIGVMAQLPLIKIIGAFFLLAVAVDLVTGGEGTGRRPAGPAKDFWAVVALVILADAVMSLDNVIAIVAVADGNVFYMLFGLIISIPMLLYGSMMISGLLDRLPFLTLIGGAMLGWIAGHLGVTDPLVAGWIDTQAPALEIVVPLAFIVYVLVASGRPRALAERQAPSTGIGDGPTSLADALIATQEPVRAEVAVEGAGKAVVVPEPAIPADENQPALPSGDDEAMQKDDRQVLLLLLIMAAVVSVFFIGTIYLSVSGEGTM